MIEFADGQESIASAYAALVGAGAVDAYDEASSTWSLTKGGVPILAVTLMPNAEKDPQIIALMHQAAYDLFVGRPLSGFDTLPSLYVSMVQPVKGLGEVVGKNLRFLGGIHNYYPSKDDGRYLMLAGPINQ